MPKRAARAEVLELPKDTRKRKQRDRARKRADDQVEQVRTYWDQRERGPKTAALLIANRNRRAVEPDRARDYDVIAALDRDGEPVLVVRGEVLIRSDDLTDDLVARLARLGYAAKPVAKLDGRVFVARRARLRVTAQPALRGDLARDASARPAASGRAPRFAVRPNYIAPMGIVMKASCGPEPAPPLGDLPFGAASKNPVSVAVIDTGIADQKRTDGWLAGVAVSGDNEDILDDIPKDDRLDFGAGHGTFAVGIIQRLAPEATIRVYRALDTDGLGSEATVATTIVQAAEDGAQIINLSCGLETVHDHPPIALEAAVELIRERWPHVLLVAAAGNFGRNRRCWPAAFKNVTAVGGLTRELAATDWSSYGPWVDCSTIGEGVLSTFVKGTESDDADPEGNPDTFPQNAWAVWTGTSFAAPQVVGAVAQIAQRLGIGPRDALARLLDGRAELPNYGRVVPILPPT